MVYYLQTYAHYPSRARRKLFVFVRFLVFRIELKIWNTFEEVQVQYWYFQGKNDTCNCAKNTFFTCTYIQKKLVLHTYDLPKRCVSLISIRPSSLASIWHCSYGARACAKFQPLSLRKPLTQMSYQLRFTFDSYRMFLLQ